MALLGSSIDPSLFVNDYSGFAKAGETQGQMYAQIGKDIGSMAQTGAKAYTQYKEVEGQKKAFGKSMDYMAKAFPDKAELFTNAKASVFDPNINMYEAAGAMNQYGSTISMIERIKDQENQQRMLEYRLGGGASGSGAASNQRF